MDKNYLAQNINKFELVNKEQQVLKMCKGKHVLNVGCIGQDKYYESEEWQHKKISNASEHTIGVDIQKEEVAKLQNMGYDVLLAEDLLLSGKTFDIIIMSDVIEHVDNALAFIEFYTPFLKEDGVMLISTPNAFHFARFLWILIWKNYSVNEEHTLWYCPLTLAELVSRSSLHIKDFYWCEEYFDIKTLNIRYRWIYRLSRFFARSRKNLSPNFMMALSK